MNGLSSEQAQRAWRQFGPNALPAERGRSLGARIRAQLASALIYLLLLAVLVDLVTWAALGAQGVPLEGLAILAVVLLNATLGIAQEYRSEKGLHTETRILEGAAPWLAIWQYASRANASLICMGVHSKDAVQSLVMGSQAQALLQHSRIPVVLVPPDRES